MNDKHQIIRIFENDGQPIVAVSGDFNEVGFSKSGYSA